MKAIILAAGDATRMPNKLMLSTPAGLPLICDSIAYAKKYTDDVVLVVKPNSLLHRIAPRLGAQTVTQQHPAGVVDAISTVNARRILVLFGDCYGYRRLPEILENHATVVEGPVPQLDGYDCGWEDRITNPKLSFVGGFRTDGWDPCFKGSLMEIFNVLHIKPQLVDTRIVDCGTPKGYESIWLS